MEEEVVQTGCSQTALICSQMPVCLMLEGLPREGRRSYQSHTAD